MEPFERNALRAARSHLLKGLRGHILEIGAGLGQSFYSYPSGTQVTAIEPFESFRLEAERVALRSEQIIHVENGDAHRLRFADTSFDGLFCSIVLCSLQNTKLALEEMKRVLKPGSPARFLEHVRSSNPAIASMQHALTPLWAAFDGSGCSITRDTLGTLEDAGYSIEYTVEVEIPGIVGLVFPTFEIYTRT
jgi:ubiquinone/menaquinone biosynthesis C-methylase UbiE